MVCHQGGEGVACRWPGEALRLDSASGDCGGYTFRYLLLQNVVAYGHFCCAELDYAVGTSRDFVGAYMPRPLIQRFCQQREIPHVVHFTRLVNLPSILEHGLYPVSEQQRLRTAPVVNDVRRLDGHLDGTSVSISFPNYLMFYRYRQETNEEWVVLRIDPSVLWDKECGFCRYNAADGRISVQPLEQLRTLASLQSLFCEDEGENLRVDRRLRIYDPTDPQAEVLVFNRIEPHLITGVSFQTQSARERHAATCGDRTLRTDGPSSGYFASRNFVR